MYGMPTVVKSFGGKRFVVIGLTNFSLSVGKFSLVKASQQKRSYTLGSGTVPESAQVNSWDCSKSGWS